MSEKAFLQSPLFDCASCQYYRRCLETVHNGLENCFPKERRKGAEGVRLERKKLVELKDYTEIIW